MWKPYLKFITKRFLDIIPHTESSSSFPSFSLVHLLACSPLRSQPSEQSRKFKIIDFRLGVFKFMLKNAFLFMFVSLKREQKMFSVTISSLNPPRNLFRTAKQSSSTKKIKSKSQPRVSERENSNERLKIIDENKNNHEKFSFCLCVFFDTAQKKFYNKKASLSKVHLKVFRKAQQQNSPDLTVSVRFPPFSILLKQKKLRRRCVWQPENVYNHLKYITVEYKRHYANRTYFCHFPS